jgi:hypothetical protein
MPEVIKASYEIVDYPKNAIARIEVAARTCYKSEDLITLGSGEPLVRGLVKKGHWPMIEFGGVLWVKFLSNRGFTHELVRHRLASYAQESTRYCVAGHTDLSMKNPHQKCTVAELYRDKITSSNGSWKRLNIRQVDETTGELIYAKIRDIILIGRRQTVTITTRLGYTLALTPDHAVLTEEGYLEAESLLGKRVAVNGTDLAYQNHQWLLHQYSMLNKTAVQIAEEFGWTSSVVKKWARKHGLSSKPTSYWNKGRPAWNKGLTKKTDARVAQLADSRRNYTGGLTNRTCARAVGEVCEICGKKHNLNVHHVDEDRRNNDLSNLMTLCVSCHHAVHGR